MTRHSTAWELAFAALAIAAAVPVWLVTQPPIQDLPQHLAAIRVLHDYGNPAFGFEPYFEIHLGRTQYLTYYLLTHLLSYPLGLVAANKLVLTAAIAGLPYSLRALLTSLGRDWRLALLAGPLVWNAHLVLGFVNFAAAIPLALWGLSLAVSLRLSWDLRRALLLTGVGLLTFFTHVVPFGFLGLGVVAVSLGGDRRSTLRLLSPLLPALAATLGWALTSPAAQTLIGSNAGVKPTFHPLARSFREVGQWLFDVLQSRSDDQLMAVWVLLIVAVLVLGTKASDEDALRRSLAGRLALLGPAAFVAYFVAPASYDWIWPINGRLPLLGALFSLLALPLPGRRLALPVYVGAALVSLLFYREVAVAFRRSEREELAGVDAALDSIPMGKRVVGLVWEHESRFVKWSPYLHAAAMYQAKRGGAVSFSFAEYPQSPFSFKPNNRPPELPRRWEWSPAFVRPVPDLGWYDFVIARGDPGTLRLYAEAFELHHDGARWQVWKRRDPSLPFEGADAVQRFLGDLAGLKLEPGSSCATLAQATPDGTLQAGLAEVVRRASSKQGRCGALSAGVRSCGLELRKDTAPSFDFSVELWLKDGALEASSARCTGALPQPPM
ncbi:MAG: hypothetical protein IPM35_13365 [Myxococcales bacterium]|nr:hypothetical protein [Myxococcales bacterium]